MNPDLNCGVVYGSESHGEFFDNTACGTIMSITGPGLTGRHLYRPHYLPGLGAFNAAADHSHVHSPDYSGPAEYADSKYPSVVTRDWQSSGAQASSSSGAVTTLTTLEMTRLTRSQILQQAGVSMLAQANQTPQNVLELLG